MLRQTKYISRRCSVCIWKRGLSSRVQLPDRETTVAKFVFPSTTHTIGNVALSLERYLGKEITLHGWMNSKPRKVSKRLAFGELRDYNGDITQIVIADEEMISLQLQLEDAIAVTGTISRRRPKKDQSEESVGKLWDLNVIKLQILNRSNLVPSQLKSLDVASPDYPPEYRYLQLRSKFFQDALKLRAKALQRVRSSLDSLSFTEIETPLLFKSTPEGANEFLVPTRRKSYFYALPQSPQQYKQLLMASGVKSYYQVARCFRDEDLRADRQPEFTQIDIEMSFADGKQVRHAVEQVVNNVWLDVKKSPLYVPFGTEQLIRSNEFPLMSYKSVLELYGIDKPDLRSSLRFHDISEFTTRVANPDFPVFEVCVLKQAFEGSHYTIPDLLIQPDNYKSRRPAMFAIKSTTDLNNWHQHFSEYADIDSSQLEELTAKLNLQPGDIVAGADRAILPYENPTPLGRFRQLAIEQFPTKWRRTVANSEEDTLKDLSVATWVVDFPLFNPVEEDQVSGKQNYPLYKKNQYESTHHPFTMCSPADYYLLSTDPLAVHGEHYDLVVNGVEVGGGSRRIHDSNLQQYIFKEILGIQDPHRLFGHLLGAFESGCPPHAGFAIGFDRLCAMLLGSTSIRDVIAFPKNQKGRDPVTESPSMVPSKTLEKYHIREIEACHQ
ncbi:hypothetical protein LJB42_000824 [Komagataella kurtzmanii]|nr:hypothetical protein LJB42_000824 [Komagataella kurtzmanii]